MNNVATAPADLPTATQDVTSPLTASDRCDYCGAAAYVRVLLNGSELLFCGHHASEYEVKLRAICDAWHDERDRIPA